MSGRDLAALIMLAAVWGASFLFMRIASPALGPFVTVELRVVLAAIALLAYAKVIRHSFQFKLRWKQYLLIGALNAAIPFTLITTAELHMTASLASILNATSPLFTALVAWVWVKEPLGLKKILGLVVGVIGVAVLVGWSPESPVHVLWLSVLLSLVAALFYGIAGNYAAQTFKGVKPLDMAIGQQVGAGLVLIPFAAFTVPAEMPSMNVIFSVLGLALLSTSLAYLLYFYLINSVGAVKTLSVTFLIPIFGILWGALFLGESVSVNTFVGMFIIFLSILLVTRNRKNVVK